MKINTNILKNYSKTICNHDIVDLSNNHIAEVEKQVFLTKNTNLVVGKILNIENMVNSTHLKLLKMDIEKAILSIVCSDNCLLIGQKVIVAVDGSYIEKLGSIIKPKKFFDIVSQGMLCSLQDLGISEKYLTPREKEGVYVFEDQSSIKIGTDVLELLFLKGFLLELNVTPDRVDLYSHIGFLKDLNATLKQTNHFLTKKISVKNHEIDELNPFQVKIESDFCYENNLRYIKDIDVKSSPLWLKNLLLKSDIIPINNLVDIANFILIDYGIPIEFFDADQFNYPLIKIRNAKFNEKIMTSEKKNYCLNTSNILICNDQSPISLAGIIGCDNSQINYQTKSIIVMAAYYDPKNIADTMKQLNIQTQISLYHKRGIDQHLVVKALEKACQLVTELANGKITKNIITQRTKLRQNPLIFLSFKFICQKTGINWDVKQVEKILNLLDYEYYVEEKIIDKFSLEKDILFKVRPPLRRYDVKIPEDVISDLLRIYGYNNLDVKNFQKNSLILRTVQQQKLKKLRYLLKNIGFVEIITYSLVSKSVANLFLQQKDLITILNPLSKDKDILRPNLVSGFLDVFSYNQKRQNFDNAFFEIGKVYFTNKELLSLALGLSGNFINSGWLKNNVASSFFLLKGILDQIAFFLKLELELVQTNIYDNLHALKQAHILLKGQKIGFIGEINNFLQNIYQLRPTYVLEIHLKEEMLNQDKLINFQEISKFPSVSRDLSFLINKKYNFATISNTINTLSTALTFKFELLDVYQDDKLFLDQHSLTFRFIFNDLSSNLKGEQIDKRMIKIIDILYQKYHILVR